MNKYYLLLLFLFLLPSCGTYKHFKTSDFVNLENPKEIEGTYVNRTNYVHKYLEDTRPLWSNYREMLKSLKLTDGEEHVDFVTLAYVGADSLKVTYKNRVGENIAFLKGEMKEKYFEVYFHKKQSFIPLVYSQIDVDRIRIGKSKDGGLLVQTFIDRSSNILFFGGTDGEEKSLVYPHISLYKGLRPFDKDGKWGYTDASGSDVKIMPQYDFASAYEREITRVQLNEKWGIIDDKGQKCTDIKYDWITPFDTVSAPMIAMVRLNGKMGIIDSAGTELLPPIYDSIENYLSNGMAQIQIGDKYGFADSKGIIIPAIYTNVRPFRSTIYPFNNVEYTTAFRDEKEYWIDRYGYEYDTLKGNKVDLNSKRKIPQTEQSIY